MSDQAETISVLDLMDFEHTETIPKWLNLFLNRMIPDKVIFDDDGVSPYLGREYLTGKFWRDELELPGFMLHWFFRGDHDRELHSHPWRWSCSLVLWGGYHEERFEEGSFLEAVAQPIEAEFEGESPAPLIVTRRLGPLSINVLKHDTFHRVKLCRAEGALTLFIAGPKLPGRDGDNWGFVSRDGKTYETCNERDDRLARERGRAVANRPPFDAARERPSLRKRVRAVARAALERSAFVPMWVYGAAMLAAFTVMGESHAERT